MTEGWKKFEKLFEGEIAISLLNEPTEPEGETARERADRVWKMKEPRK
jgi:hypothetical protein